jgi:hypothetical protein
MAEKSHKHPLGTFPTFSESLLSCPLQCACDCRLLTVRKWYLRLRILHLVTVAPNL